MRIAIIASVAVGAVLALLFILKAALTPLVAAFVLAYLLDPLIDRIEAWGIPRRLAILLLVGLAGVVLVGVLAVLVPILVADISRLGQQLPDYVARVLETWIPRFEMRTGVEVPGTVQELLQRAREGELQLPLDTAREAIQRLVSILTGTVSGVIGLLVVPVLAYYALLEFDHTKLRVLEAVPPRYRDEVVEKASTIDRLVSGFLRGQLTVALCLGVLYAAGFSVIGIDLAVGVGLLAGVMALIPYLGNVVALATAAILCMLEFGVDYHLLLVAGWFAVVQNLEGFVLTPRIVGRSVGLHPALVIVALLIGADLFGFLGLLVAVPLAAVVKVFVGDALAAWRGSNLFDPEDDLEETSAVGADDTPREGR